MSDHIAQVRMSFEYYRTTDFTARRRSATSTNRKSNTSATSFLLMDFEWIHPRFRLFRVGRHQRKVRDLQVLLGFTNFYRALIHDYSSMTANLTKLFKKDAPFVWGPEQEKSLQIKTAFANSDFLTHPDDSRPFILETDASDYAISGVLSQYDDSNTLRPIAFYARQMTAPNKTMKFTTKSCWLSSSRLNIGGISSKAVSIQSPSCAITRTLEYFMTTKKLTRRQARWSLELSEYDFSLTHRPGKLNGRTDSLSRREDYKSNSESSNFQRILDPSKVVDLQSLVANMDLHLLLHSQVLENYRLCL
ncbi:hypothetical protein BASA83_011644 [Batrachochytrium salamandrivorans]|nr:hypothetical protein BASA83_011644 [Batrachochytrium salamandrivorans]